MTRLTKANQKTACAVYLRVSSAQQADQQNLDAQEKECREYAKRKGLNVLKVFVDPGKTGRNINRKELQSLLTFCRQNRDKLRAVVCYDVSRWARSVSGWATTMDTLDELGIEFHSVLENVVGRSASVRYVANIHAATAQHFSDLLSEKMQGVLHHRLSLGLFPHKAPVGYRNLVKGRDERPASGVNIIPDPESVPLIVHAFNAVAAGLRPMEDVRKEVNALGLRTSSGRELPRQSFYNMLRNEIYAGWVVSGELRVKGLHEPIVSQEVFDAVQEVLSGKKPDRKPYKKTREDFPLRQFVACAKCGRGLTAGFNRGRSKQYPFYFCYTRTCKAVSIRAEELHRLFKNLLERHQPTQEALLKGLPEMAAGRWAVLREGMAERQKKLTQRQHDITTQNNAALDKMLRGTITEKAYTNYVEPTTHELEQIEELLAGLQKQRITLEELTEQVKAEAIDLAGTWERGSFDTKLDLQRSLFGRYLYFEPKTVDPFLNQQNTLLSERLRLHFAEATADTYVPEGWIGEGEASEGEVCQVGVGDGD
jgi:site-specific DNA recombinase